MRSMQRWVLCVAIFFVAGLAGGPFFSFEKSAEAQAQHKNTTPTNTQSAPTASKSSNNPATPASGSEIERGKYLVENVAMCEECHTPRNSNGDLDESRRLQGAPIWITPVHRTTNWSMRAPALAGFEEFTEEQGEQILEKGVGPNGLPIQPPMHIYHMSHADAQAVIAYLRSLSGAYPEDQ
jgi:Cytochrome c